MTAADPADVALLLSNQAGAPAATAARFAAQTVATGLVERGEGAPTLL